MDSKARGLLLHFRAILLGLAALLLASCQTAPVTGVTAAATGPLPPLPVQGTVHYALDAARSDVRFLVYRAGALAALIGHNHVIEAKQLSGDVYLAPDIRASGFSLTLPVAGFTVDDPAARAVEGPDFAPQPSASAIEGTRSNMLGPEVLDVEHFPEISIRSVKLLGPDWGLDATVRITLHGVSRDVTVPIALQHDGDNLSVTGAFDIKQSDFGITPLSKGGGALQVADGVRIRFHLAATKTP
ncbi:MAG TPA: YceI family protein [Gammaproteobacteria bacterium]|nr:YceI family protein [Gammaproteobacteria bacterium]